MYTGGELSGFEWAVCEPWGRGALSECRLYTKPAVRTAAAEQKETAPPAGAREPTAETLQQPGTHAAQQLQTEGTHTHTHVQGNGEQILA